MNVTAYRRGRTVRTLAASMLAVAALGLTAACGGSGDGGSDNEGKAKSSASAPGPSSNGQDAGTSDKAGAADKTAKGGNAGAKDAKDAKTQAQKAGAGSEEEPIGDCDINKTVFSLQKVKNPINHLLLKATNGAGVDCKLVGYPGLKFGEDAQSATPVNEDSRPQSVVVLAPGESTYAGITTSAGDGSGSEGSEVNSLEVFIDGSEDPVSVELPGGSVYIDSAAQVTYWQTTAQDALTW
ncbi:DUF4232 domain-containing protein [Streptomyces sp. NEAU-YJ-81]|uniref:DUF4232 domain-containing protein n=1 Tax=Streptomyces sp. NEAU-YJ-81 TaxID=2820288 RepID=UPI001ABBE595|nr:DUF4232 domain-containing protein [Streptomyces sp. NEAU-YJ-81]MBO3673612.1 DUF4232 domain-containing protein [Streptomyces sp. NEAU-YJ-81]